MAVWAVTIGTPGLFSNPISTMIGIMGWLGVGGAVGLWLGFLVPLKKIRRQPIFGGIIVSLLFGGIVCLSVVGWNALTASNSNEMSSTWGFDLWFLLCPIVVASIYIYRLSSMYLSSADK